MRRFVLNAALGVTLLAGCGAKQLAAPAPKETRSRSSESAAFESDPSDAGSTGSALLQAKSAVFFGPGYPPDPSQKSPYGRVGSTTWGTWIQPKPDSRSLPLGAIRVGSSLPLSEPGRVQGSGACREFVHVEGGYVCTSRRSTLDMNSAFMRAGRWTTPEPGPFPYEFALSVGAPMLTRIPEPGENRWPTGDRDIKMRGWSVGHDELAEDELIEENGPIPDVLENGGSLPNLFNDEPHLFFKTIPRGSMLAYTRAFEANGEVWVLSTNMTIVPAKGLKHFRRSSFHGVELKGDRALPLSWIRHEAKRKWRRNEAGEFVETDASWPLRSWVGLVSDEPIKSKAGRFYATREPGMFIKKQDATLVQAISRRPWEVKGSEKWIHIKVLRGTLTLYEGTTPLFTTLMSPGKEDSTPYGRYRIESKHHVSTMTTEMGEPRKFWIADVPWTIYFKRPYAIHAAYWHEDFGVRKSGGCVNLSPLDAKRVFDWVEPPLPETWGSVQAIGARTGTFVLVEG